MAWYGVVLVDGMISRRGTERNYGVQNWVRSFTPDKVKPWFKRVELALEQLAVWRMGSILPAPLHSVLRIPLTSRYFSSTAYYAIYSVAYKLSHAPKWAPLP